MSPFAWQVPTLTVTAYTNSDWPGCKKTGRSTSGGIIMVGSRVIKSYSKQRRTIALSSAEAELHAMVAARAECLGIMALLKGRYIFRLERGIGYSPTARHRQAETCAHPGAVGVGGAVRR